MADTSAKLLTYSSNRRRSPSASSTCRAARSLPAVDQSLSNQVRQVVCKADTPTPRNQSRKGPHALPEACARIRSPYHSSRCPAELTGLSSTWPPYCSSHPLATASLIIKGVGRALSALHSLYGVVTSDNTTWRTTPPCSSSSCFTEVIRTAPSGVRYFKSH